MTGKVYKIPVDHTDDKGRPHVLILDIGEDYLAVPAFSKGRPMVTAAIKAFRHRYAPVSDKHLFAELDNSEYVEFFANYEPHEAYWVYPKFQRIDKRTLRGKRPIGEMNKDGLKIIVDGMLGFASAAKDRFSPHLLKKLRKLQARLGENC